MIDTNDEVYANLIHFEKNIKDAKKENNPGNKENQHTNHYYVRKRRSHAELELPLSLEQELSDLSIRCNLKKKLKLENNLIVTKEDLSSNNCNQNENNNGEILIKDENDEEIVKINLDTEKQLVDKYYSKKNKELLEAMFGKV